MASNSQRVAAFFLAALFLLSTIATTVYIVWQINQEEGGIVQETAEEKAAADALAQQQDEPESDPNACSSTPLAATDPRTLPTTTTASGTITELRKIDIKEGTGAEVQPGDCVAALYYGTLASDGTKFDGNYETGQTIEFSLNRVIQGWTDGIPGMKVGGIRRLEIPAAQAYGEQGGGDVIPPNADLIFEVEVIGTRQAQ